MKKLLPALLLAVCWGMSAPVVDLDRARHLYGRTEYDEALRLLEPSSRSSDANVQELLGKIHFMRGDYKKAVDSFERALAVNPNSSAYEHWLGRTWGRRAETSNMLLAPSYASKARQHFERAVQLDIRNIEAVNDLFTYYLEAPGFLGGGLDKAAALAKKIEAVDPIEGHYAQAQIAEKRKELKTAEQHFRQAMELAPRNAGRIIDLARFLSKQGREQESDALFARAEKITPNQPRLLFERASAYVRAKRNLSTAKLLIEQYLRSPLTPDDPPRAEAERLLKQTQATGS